MNAMDIAFPNLGIYLENVPRQFNVLGLNIALYGVFIAVGVVAGVLLAEYQAILTGSDPEVIWDFVIYAILFSVIGARLYYVVFSWDLYKDHLWRIIDLRSGGMAIFGCVIASFLTLFVFCRRRRISALRLGDNCISGLLLGQVIGRFGNFTNREAFGGYTESLFAMKLPVKAVNNTPAVEKVFAQMGFHDETIQVHPTFLYESAWNLVLLVLILIFRKKQKFDGEVILWYLGGYGLGRFLIEGMRTDQLLIAGTQVPVSQAVAAVMVLFAVITVIVTRARIRSGRKKALEYVYIPKDRRRKTLK